MAPWWLLLLLCICPVRTLAAPQLLRITSLHLDADRSGGVRDGELRLTAVLHDAADGSTVESLLLTNSASLNVRDGGRFNVDVPLTSCRRVRAGVVCATASRRVLLKRANASRYKLRVVARDLDSQVTGDSHPLGPVRVTLIQSNGSDRVDIISDCQTSGVLGVGCRDRQRPNIVYIVTDDQRWDTLQYMPRTLDRLAAQGVSFSNAFVATPLCGPSRASMLTGQYARHHGVLTNAGPSGGAPAMVGADASTLATWLRAVGYRTGMYGKYMVGYAAQCPPYRAACYEPPGWDEWHVFWTQHYYDYALNENGLKVNYGATDTDYSTDVITAKAVEFIHSAQGQPFFLHVGYHAPHGEAGGVPQPATRHALAFRGLPPWIPRPLPPWRPASWDEDDVGDKPAWFAGLPRAADPVGPFTWGNFGESARLLQLEAALAVDEGIESIVSAIEATGHADNTVIVLTSDNGYFWGEHRFFGGKDYPYEESVRIPFIIRYPRLITSARSEPALVLNIDIPPTLARLAGVEPPVSVDGLSLKPLLRQEVASVRDDFLLEWWNLAGAPGLTTYTGIRTTQWKYVSYPTAGEAELYDLVADPNELDNVAHEAAHQDVVASLQARLDALLEVGQGSRVLGFEGSSRKSDRGGSHPKCRLEPSNP